jgi:sarcosine oxidase subunit gamma
MVDLVAQSAAKIGAGRHGLASGAAGARLRVAGQRQIVSVIARRAGMESLRSTVPQVFGADLPDRPLLARGAPVSFLWCGHQQWLAMADGGADLLTTLRQHIGASASLSHQSDSRIIVELAGPAARAILAKLVPIDLHPSVFPSGATALTVLEHVPAHVTQIGEEPAYELMAFRSFADSFLHSIMTAGAEFGIDVVA